MTKLAAYVGYVDKDDAKAQAATTSRWNSLVIAMGQTPTLMLSYVDKDHPVKQWVSDQQWNAQSWKATPWLANAQPILGLPMGKASDFATIASGGWDATIKGILAAWATAGYHSMYLRPGWEMNGDWYTWQVTKTNAANFAKAFQHIVQVARSYQGMTIKTVWNPNVGDPANTKLPFDSYYPGDAYVDVIAIDIYGPPLNQDSVPLDSSTGVGNFTLKAALAYAQTHGKPFGICETGAKDIGFPANLANVVAAAGVPVEFVGLWNIDDPTASPMFSNDAAASAAWRAAYAKMSGTVAVPQPTPVPTPVPVPTPPSSGGHHHHGRRHN